MLLPEVHQLHVGHHTHHPLGAGSDQLTPYLMAMQKVGKCKLLFALQTLVRLLGTRTFWMLSRHMSSHPLCLIGTCLECASVDFARIHCSSLGYFLLDSFPSRPKPSKRTPDLGV